MRKFAFSSKFFQISIIRLCHRQSLLAMLLAACLILPVCIAPAMESFFSRGVSFSGINLAITAPEECRVERLMLREGISEEYARSRIGAQRPQGEFAALCEHTLHNDGTPEQFRQKCLAFFNGLGII